MRTKKPGLSPYKRRFYKPSRWTVRKKKRDPKHFHLVVGSRRKKKRYNEYMSMEFTSKPTHAGKGNIELPDNPRLKDPKPNRKSHLRPNLSYGKKYHYSKKSKEGWVLSIKDVEVIEKRLKLKNKKVCDSQGSGQAFPPLNRH